MCSHLPPKALLLGLAQTAKATRGLLTPRCFSSHPLELGCHELRLLSSCHPRSSSLSSLHFRVLAGCILELYTCGVNVQRALDTLRHFPAFHTLRVEGGQGQGLSDRHLFAFLHSPAALSCRTFAVLDLTRCPQEKAPVNASPPCEAEVRLRR